MGNVNGILQSSCPSRVDVQYTSTIFIMLILVTCLYWEICDSKATAKQAMNRSYVSIFKLTSLRVYYVLLQATKRLTSESANWQQVSTYDHQPFRLTRHRCNVVKLLLGHIFNELIWFISPLINVWTSNLVLTSSLFVQWYCAAINHQKFCSMQFQWWHLYKDEIYNWSYIKSAQDIKSWLVMIYCSCNI